MPGDLLKSLKSFNPFKSKRYNRVIGLLKKIRNQSVQNFVQQTRTLRLQEEAYAKQISSLQQQNQLVNYLYDTSVNDIFAVADAPDGDVDLCIITCLPPTQSGIAIYSYKSFAPMNLRAHFFTNIDDIYRAAEISRDLSSQDQRKKIFSVSYLEQALRKYTYKKIIYIIGNSNHNLPAFEAAVKFGAAYAHKSYLYLHEININFLVFEAYQKDFAKITGAYRKYYNAPENIQDVTELTQHGYYGTKILIERSGIKNVLVNSTQARDLLMEEAKDIGADMNVDVLFHPIFALSVHAGKTALERDISKDNRDEIIIGHFGMVNSLKGVDTLMEATRILSQTNQVRLIFAGYNASDIFSSYSQDTYPFIEVYEDLDTQGLLAMMARVSVAVQTRDVFYGETSGVICQLMGLGKHVVASKSTSAEIFKPYIHLVDKDISAAELAHVIQDVTQRREPAQTPEFQEFTEAFSVNSFEEIFKRKVLNASSSGKTSHTS